MRTLKLKVKAEKVDMDGIQVDQALPIMMLKNVDPFILIHHWKEKLKGGQRQRETGVAPHPHRGFTPVTVVFEGEIHHRDSLGNSRIIGPGGVQWMNSGKGITHSERPSKNLAEGGGVIEIVQFWVNIPSDKKMEAASYQPLTAEQLPLILQDGGKAKIQLIAGKISDKRSPVICQSPLLIARIDIMAGSSVNIPIPEDFELLIYVLSGSLILPDKNTGEDKELLWFKNEGERLVLQAFKDTRAIILAGKPIGEPIFNYGPFVLNNENEIMLAIRDYQMGKMGILIEDFE